MEKLSVRELISEGKSLLNEEKFEEAINYFETAITKNPENPIAWLNRGITFFLLGKFNNANYCCNKALILDPSFSEAHTLQEGIKKELKNADDELILLAEAPDAPQLLIYSRLQKKIYDLGGGTVFMIVGAISLIGFVISIALLFLDIYKGLGVNWSLLILSVISLLTAVAWFNLLNNHEKTIKIFEELLNWVKKETQEE